MVGSLNFLVGVLRQAGPSSIEGLRLVVVEGIDALCQEQGTSKLVPLLNSVREEGEYICCLRD